MAVPAKPPNGPIWPGWAEYGYCASHSRYLWGLRLHLVCTLHPLPLGWVLTGATADERHALHDMLANTNNKQILIGDNNYFGAEFESQLADGGIELLRRARTGEKPRPGSEFFTPLR